MNEIHRKRLIVYPEFRGRLIRHCRYRWRRSRNKPSSAEVIGSHSWLAESTWRSTLLGYSDVPSQGVRGARRRTTHAVPFPLEQKHYPHMEATTWHARGTQRSLYIVAASPSFFSGFSLDCSLLVIASTRSREILYTLVAFCVSREGPNAIHEAQWTRSTCGGELKTSGRGPPMYPNVNTTSLRASADRNRCCSRQY